MGSLRKKVVSKNAAKMLARRTTKTETDVERAWSLLVPPIDAARVRAAEVKPASAQADINKRIAPN